MPRPITTIIFDVGGVLVFNDNEKLLATLIKDMDRPPSPNDLISFVRAFGIGDGSTTIANMHAAASETFGYRADFETFASDWCCHFSPNRPMLEWLAGAGKRFRTSICSNTNEAHWRHVDSIYGLSGLVDRVIVSYECGFEKPDERIFERVLSRLRVSPENCLFVDDALQNVAAAAKLGFAAHHFGGARKEQDFLDRIQTLSPQ